jgi:hypothetical protein
MKRTGGTAAGKVGRMDGHAASGQNGRTDRREDGHAAVRPRVKKAKRTICLTPEASSMLDTQAFGMHLDVSELVERMVRRYCGDYVLKYRPSGGAENPDPSPADVLKNK